MSQLAPRPKFPAVKFLNLGDSVTGTVALEPEDQQVKIFETGALAVWPDGQPKMQTRVVLNTAEGTEALYAKDRILVAIRKAVAEAGAPDVEIGGTLTVTYTGDGERKGGGYPPKLYKATYAPPTGSDDGPPF